MKTLTSEIGDTYRSVFSNIGKFFLSLAVTPFVNHVKRRRGALTDRYFIIPGDILLYQARGHNIRNFIKKSIERADFPVVLLAHSLGGVACMELLVQESLPQVKLLVTMGSQAPFLYEIDALHCLSYGTPLPGHFPYWLNIYNLRDFLSYVGAAVFPGRVTDVRITSLQPFPQSHHAMAYLSNKDTWDNILKKMKSIND